MPELRHILNGLADSSTLKELQRFFEDQAVTVRLAVEAVEAAKARSAELSARLAAWRAAQAPTRLARNREVMRLYRLGHGDEFIGANVSPKISGRQVRRIVRAELQRYRSRSA